MLHLANLVILIPKHHKKITKRGATVHTFMLPAILMIELKMVLQTRYAARHVDFPDVPANK